MLGRIGMCAVMALGAIAAVGGTQAAPPQATAQEYLLKPARVFDGNRVREGYVVHVRGERIIAAGPEAEVKAPGAEVMDLPGMTLLPGLIDAHSHVLLHPYDEAPWNTCLLYTSPSPRD